MKISLIIISFLVISAQNGFGVEKGMASWYGAENSRSSTGKTLYHKIPAAAHKTLPIGTMIKITSVKNNKSVIAVIEDRGPYTKGRIVDVNRVAASQLGMLKSGVTKVTVEKVINQ
jgi:rare lipoprotein A